MNGPVNRSAGANYPFNSWYVAATSDEVGRRLLGRSLLGQDLVLFRQASGNVVALEDRCAHRSLPLSQGHLDGDVVVCRYHGFAYDGGGACVRVPSQPQVPYGARVRAYLVHERRPFVWIWMGAPTASAPPRLPWLNDSGWATCGGVLHVGANYMLLQDNALDLTHFPFVHPETSPYGYRASPPPELDVEVTETSVSYRREFPPARLAEWQSRSTGLPADENYVERESGTFVSPGVHVDFMDIVPNSPRDPTDTYRKVFVRGFTPETPTSTHVFWQVARNYRVDDNDVTDHLHSIHVQSILDDKPLLESIQAVLDRSPWVEEFRVNADRASLKAHQIVSMMLSEERGRTRVRPGFATAQG